MTPFRPPPLSRLEPEGELSYMSVKDAIQELNTATIYNKQHAPASVRLPPTWSLVHANEQMRLTGRSSGPRSPNERLTRAAPTSPMRTGTGMEGGGVWATQSSASSVPHRYQTSGVALGSGSAINSAYTHYYGAAPLNPALTNNEYSGVGSLSMFGSQMASGKVSSSAFGFGTATREQRELAYISPAHLRANLCKFSPGPATYNMNSSLGRQVLNDKRSCQSTSFGLEERFDPDRRMMLATCTPGPGTYRV
eukprot:CAMPEP_0119071998 /NCGR_PEP_ID=MMETSP1178-20130426/56474_1 /TAXON_ID=33656 /ORGANISM="unid sp, Strain CCMP2000" /LENGTH=250 /DNA_ID=CAMNT_0007053973 /DNA_START=48 /DNA_END=800 /DNA_ORIENTATION=+